MRAACTPCLARIGREPGPLLDDVRPHIAAGRVLVAEREGQALGVLVLVPQADALLLDNIAVAPEAQGSGLGRLMLDHAEQAARNAGLPAVILYTDEAMTGNLALYARRGCRETHRAVEKGLRRVTLRKPLDAR